MRMFKIVFFSYFEICSKVLFDKGLKIIKVDDSGFDIFKEYIVIVWIFFYNFIWVFNKDFFFVLIIWVYDGIGVCSDGFKRFFIIKKG